ncbi:MAG: NAD(P)-dependent dehydrogenase (short-subunit alcohol dehydrogenase family) [Cellvibrionaceae bacterium]|jgi:NAD(P)-dependent dehydrogenase (short-subunit alcohol dehydrogenase family)
MNKIALITGAGSGIGRACALKLLECGYCVVLTGRNVATLEETRELAGDFGLSTFIYTADVGKPDQVEKLFAACEQTYGRLDLLFNNAGRSSRSVSLDELSFEEWQSVVDVNLTGSFLCTQQAFRLMRKQVPQGGRIINNGSISATAPRPNSAPYTATKHAITGLTKSTSLDGRKFNIACGQLDIGNAATEMTEGMAKGVPQADGSIKVEPRMNVAHVADALLYMASLPLNANVQFMTVMATAMPLIGRG